MSNVSPLVDSLIEAFQCLPGVGPKSAQRMVLHLLERNRNAGQSLALILGQALESVDKCSNCRIFTESSTCQICLSEKEIKNKYVLLSLFQMFSLLNKVINLMDIILFCMDTYHPLMILDPMN